ncbi:MAG TPA: alkaline phosphatase family protein [Roseiflexaceae bacterium]
MNARLLIVLALLGIIVLLSLSGQGPARLMVVAGRPAPTATSTSVDVLVTATPTSTLTATLTSTATDTPPTETAIRTPIAAPSGASYLPIVLNPGDATPTTTATAGPSPTAPPTGQIPVFSHVFIIVMENEAYEEIIGNTTSAPYINSLAQNYGVALNYYGIDHPSLPNYIALAAGDTFTITNNCTSCFIDRSNITDQLEAAGKSWKAYMESMPSPCFVGDSGSLYRQKHNPFIYFDNIRNNPARCNNIVPFSQFDIDLQANALPDYVWITPNMCNDIHDCPLSTGDAWLQTWVTKILNSPAWQQDGVLFLTFDESRSSDTTGCCVYAMGGHILTLVISPLGKPAYQSTVDYDHYSLLRTIEEAWSLPLLNKANCDCSQPMADFFTPPPAWRRP